MVVASLFSYVVNKIFTFGNKEKTNFSYIIKYYIVFGLNFGVNLAVNYFVYSSTSSKLLAFIVATICGMTVNYIGQRFFVFVRAKEKI